MKTESKKERQNSPGTNKCFEVKFRGVRGSFPVPGEKTIKYGGNTSCVEVRAGRHLLILDAGTGIIELGRELSKEHSQKEEAGSASSIIAVVLLSHTHHDHILGFPFFKPAYSGWGRFYIYGPRTLTHDLEEALMGAMLPSFFPVKLDEMHSLKSICNIEDSSMIVLHEDSDVPEVLNIYRDSKDHVGEDAVCIKVMKSYAHPKDGVLIYRIEARGKSVVYATDTESYVGGDVRLIEFARNADLLIHDAEYTFEEYTSKWSPKQGWGHSTVEMAATVAKEANVKELILFHHNPYHSDYEVDQMEINAKKHFPNSRAANEGMEIDLS